MKYKYSSHCVWSEEDQAFIVCVNELPGCQADGKTVEEAQAALQVVIDEWIDTAKSLGRVVPEPLTVEQIEIIGQKFRENMQEQFLQQVQMAVRKALETMPLPAAALPTDMQAADWWKYCR